MSEPVRDDAPARDEMRDEMNDEMGDTVSDEPTGAADESAGAMPPPTSVESLVGALLEAGPEVAEHVVRAAQELLLAAQAIVDAAEKAVREQQDLRSGNGGHDAEAAAPVRRLDLAE